MESIWKKSIDKPAFPTLEGNIKTDVLIIGGGMAGLLCAYKLKEAGVDCTLLEADRICCGVTENTTAKLTLQHGLIYDKLIRKYGEEKARFYLEAQRAALSEYHRLCADIDCDYEKRDNYVYSLDDRGKTEREAEALERLGVTSDFLTDTELPFQVAGAVRVRDQAQFHPLKFAYAIARDLPIYENTKVTELLPERAKTNRAGISFNAAIVATHFPILNKHGGYFIKLYQHRSYVLALEGAQEVNGMYVDESDKGLSFRNYGELLLLGGGGHRTGKAGGSYGELEAFAKKHYPDAKIVGRWATQDCMTLDGVPYIGQYSRGTQGLYVATGFNKWGMTSSMVAATLLTDMVKGRESHFSSVFSPSRSILHPQLAANAFESLIGILTPTTPRCPHLGCALKYNKAEHTWDCPCHGSRFTENGKLINNPATDDKRL